MDQNASTPDPRQPNQSVDELTDALTAMMPPGMEKTRVNSTEALLAEMNRVPLFMTSLDPNSVEENPELDALRALAYEGTRVEIAANFREQGNECAREKRWRDGREFYTKALAALQGPRRPEGEPEMGEPEVNPELGSGIVEEVKDEEEQQREEEAKEHELRVVCLVNRALCQLEMKNYGSCNRDCASALLLSPRNVKAWYRAASACHALNKLAEALDACTNGLKFDPANKPLQALKTKVEAQQKQAAEIIEARRKRQEREAKEKATLALTFKSRAIATRATGDPPDLEDARPALTQPLDATSTLCLPVIFLYPLHGQSDFIKSIPETESLGQHLEYILPVPWDEKGEYGVEGVECFMETVDGGLVKIGKKVALSRGLSGGKVQVVDGLVRVQVVPKARMGEYVEEVKRRRGRQ
ncbi:hypothetical protein MBLNU230_g7123t1 [Neophaeotheca triangularis]